MPEPVEIAVANALAGPDYRPSGPVRLTIAGSRIATLEPLDRAPDGPARLAIPAFADAHNHARPLSTTSFGCGGKPLELWLPHLATMPAVDPYTAAAAALARSLRGGATAVMVHLTRPMGQSPLAQEAREIARAARDVGVSIAFAVSMRDRNPLIYGDHAPLIDGLPPDAAALARETWLRPLPSIAEQMALVDSVAEALVGIDMHVDVQYGPTGVQWCSDALLSAIAEASAATGRRVHMHLLETEPQRQWADAAYPEGLVTHLAEIGLLSPRLTLAHCTWARPEDLAMIAARGARVAVNTSSNLHLFSGRAPVADMLAAKVDVAMGLDGCALDEDDDALREMRLLHLLNHAPGFRADEMTPQRALRAACRTGRAALGLGDGGVLGPDMPADLILLDLDGLDRDALMTLDPRDLLFARATAAHIAEIWSGGRRVVAGGDVLGVDLPSLEASLRAQYRAALPETAALRGAWPAIAKGLAAHYRGCC